MKQLDIKTLIAVCLIGQMLSVIIFSYYLLTHKKVHHETRLYTCAKVLQLITLLLTVAFINDLTPLMMTITLLFYYPGLAIESYCLVRTEEIEPKIKLSHLLALSGLFIVLYALVSHDIVIRVVVTSVYYSLCFLFIFAMTSFNRKATQMQKLIGWISLLYVLTNITRGIFTAATGTEIFMYRQIPVQIIFGVVSIIIAFSFPVIFLLIIKERNMKALEELNRAKDKFFRIIGHDLRGPIGQMIQLSDLIREEYDSLTSEEVLNFVSAMKESSLRSFKLLENLLEWACANSGTIAFLPEKINPGELILDNIELLREQANSKNITITTCFNTDREISADINMLNSILRNLISNAIKYTFHNGTIEIKTYSDIREYTVSVKDSGQGMSGEILNNLFITNGAESTPGTDNEQGTGIGLLLCREFVERHKGNIQAQSKPGEGSEFTFSIPVQ